MSPQILDTMFYPEKGYDGRAADIWSLGMMLCTLFFGSELPYYDNAGREHSFQLAKKRLSEMHSQVWHQSNAFVSKHVHLLSAEVRDLLDRIFVWDEAKRISIEVSAICKFQHLSNAQAAVCMSPV